STGGNISFQIGIQHTWTEYNVVDMLHDKPMVSGMAPAGVDANGNLFDTATVTQATATLKFKQPLARGFGSSVALVNEHRAALEHFDIGPEEFDVDEVLARARIANRALADNLLQKKLADLDVTVAEDQVKPRLDLEVSGSLIGNGDGPSTSLSGLTGGDQYMVSVGLNAEFELSGAARKARDAATTRRHKVDADRASLEREIETKVVTSVHQVTAM